MTTDDELRALAEKATPGKREFVPRQMNGKVHQFLVLGNDYIILKTDMTQADGDFFAAASPERVIELLDEVRRLKLALDAAVLERDKANAEATDMFVRHCDFNDAT